MKSKTQVPFGVQQALDKSCLLYLQDLREEQVIPQKVTWLCDADPKKARELVGLLLEGRVELEFTIVVSNQFSHRREAAEELGWSVFASNDFVGVTDVIFIKR